jgi:hypothetical protein
VQAPLVGVAALFVAISPRELATSDFFSFIYNIPYYVLFILHGCHRHGTKSLTYFMVIICGTYFFYGYGR